LITHTDCIRFFGADSTAKQKRKLKIADLDFSKTANTISTEQANEYVLCMICVRADYMTTRG